MSIARISRTRPALTARARDCAAMQHPCAPQGGEPLSLSRNVFYSRLVRLGVNIGALGVGARPRAVGAQTCLQFPMSALSSGRRGEWP